MTQVCCHAENSNGLSLIEVYEVLWQGILFLKGRFREQNFTKENTNTEEKGTRNEGLGKMIH